jgi:hypothetical protein
MLFVEANGLKCLQKVIVYWFKSTGTHQGVQIVLRILAALPNVTPDHVLESGIGKTLRGIQMKCQNMDHLDQSLGDLATWVISSWKKKTAYRRHISLITPMRNYSVSINEKDPSQFVSNPNRSKREEERLKITKHLEQVLKGQVVQPLKKTSELPPVGTKSRKNSLGSQDAKKKEERRVIVIDTCTANVPKNITDWSKDSFGLSEKDFLYDKETVPMGRIKFGRPQIVRFETELEPFRLLETTRSKIMEAKLKAQQEQEIPAFANDQNSSMNSKEGLIPIAFRKNAKPIKSILRGVNEPKLL